LRLKPDLEVSVASAQAIVDRALAGSVVAGVTRIHGGEIAAIHEIGFADARPPVILKLYPRSLDWKMQKEVMVAGWVQDHLSVPPPRILLADDSKRLLDLDFVLMTKLEGSVLGRLEPTLTAEQLTSAYRQIGQLLREFHRIPMQAFGYLGPTGVWSPRATNQGYLALHFDRKLQEFEKRGGAGELAQRVARHVTERGHLFHACTQPVLCHNDLHAGNLLADTTDGMVRLCGVVDFEGALAGDPLMDVAKALYYLDGGQRRALLEGYGDMHRAQWSETLDLYHLCFVLDLWCWMAQTGHAQRLDKLTFDLERCLAG
jgi:aminoglycoside phosphotransferase (APT) family kinase protein